MKIGEFLYFAPSIAFADLDFREERLPSQYAQRIEGFYLTPASTLVKAQHSFAAGLLILCAIDALAKIDNPDMSVNERFKSYCMSRLPSFSEAAGAKQLYDAFRNGTVHEARAKDGAEISLESDGCVESAPGGIRVNPQFLLEEARTALGAQMAEISASRDKLASFKKYLLKQFRSELEGVDACVQQ